MKKSLLTSIFALTFAAPALAGPTNTESTFPTPPAKMAADTTYTGAATYTNLHAYEGEISATASYTPIDYTVTAGNYLPQSAEAVVTCTSGNYCPGLQNTVQYSTTQNQGLETCPQGYGASDLGASANTQCYRACDSANIGSTITSTSAIAHATTMSGNDYYGAGVDTCVPTACAAGWHLNPGAPDLTTIIGESGATGYGYQNDSAANPGGSNQSTYGITHNNEFVVDYGAKGKIHGYARCSNVEGTHNYYEYTYTNSTILTNAQIGTEAGKYCYCQLDGYTPSGNGQSMQSISAPWVFNNANSNDAGTCAGGCAGGCADSLRYNIYESRAYRAAVFGAIPAGGPSCDANIITINWGDTDTADVTANNAGTCTYGEDIRTPVKAQHKPGQTFVGWIFDAQQ